MAYYHGIGMMHESLTATDIREICKSRTFPVTDNMSKDTFKNFFLSTVGVEKAISRLSTEEIVFLSMLKNDKEVNVAYFSLLYKEYDKYGTFTQKYLNVHRSQNKIEEYHKLRAAIAKVGGRKQLYGKTDPDIEVANQCGRLVANLAICYNSLILSGLIEQNPGLLKNRKFLNKLKKISPIAWQHIHFLGQYTFKTSEEPIDMNEILKNINWKF